MKHFNNWLAIKITNGVATMWAAYLFAILAIIGFPYDNITPQSVVQWTSQTFIQLTMLAILAVSQKLISDITKDNHAQHVELAEKHHAENIKHLKRIHSSLGIVDED